MRRGWRARSRFGAADCGGDGLASHDLVRAALTSQNVASHKFVFVTFQSTVYVPGQDLPYFFVVVPIGLMTGVSHIVQVLRLIMIFSTQRRTVQPAVGGHATFGS